MMQNNDILNLFKKQQEQFHQFFTMQTITSGFLKDMAANVKYIHLNVSDNINSDEEVEFEESEGCVCYGDSLIRDCESTDEAR